MTRLPSETTSSGTRAAWLSAWNVWRLRLRGVLGHGCPLLQARGGPAVDLFSVALAGGMPHTPATYAGCALLDSGTCDGRCAETLQMG